MKNSGKNLKEAYFTAENIDTEARVMLDEISILKKKRDTKLNPSKSALLVLDMQKFFLAGNSHAFIPSAPAIIPNISVLMEALLEQNRPVIFSKHSNNNENAGQMSFWWDDLIQKDGPGYALIDPLQNYSDKVSVIEKNQYDAFLGTNLERNLKARGVEQLVITGVMTHLCCESTARSAFMNGFGVFFVVDGTATYNRKFHMGSIFNLAHGFARVVDTGWIINEVSEQK